MKGIYLVLAELNSPATVQVSNGRAFKLGSGFYAYLGSALGGLEQRIARHLRYKKRHHWHIDYFVDHARIEQIILAETEQKIECSVARSLSKKLAFIPGFGCSDCRCGSHLFVSDDWAALEMHIMSTLRRKRLSPLNIRIHPSSNFQFS
jgi:Uri superfamily endonuclease